MRVFDRLKLFYGCFRCFNGVLAFCRRSGVLEVFCGCSPGCFGEVFSTDQLSVCLRGGTVQNVTNAATTLRVDR